ncbi:MAG: hypothetical protein OIF57_01435 [Marinobacterium sp.]|nr:hypothetical protein [Marinobacterium sp.]
MNEESMITVLRDQSAQLQQDITMLRSNLSTRTQALSELTTAMARMEERHVRQAEEVKRLSREMEDHEQRLRILQSVADPEQVKKNDARITALENSREQIAGGWKILTVLGAIVTVLATAGSALLSTLGEGR